MIDLAELPPRPAWHTLPGQYYGNPAIYQQELARIWNRGWLFIAPSCELPNAGDYLTLSVDSSPILLLRGEDGVQAFHNICPHRGSLLCDKPSGHTGQVLVCPYHQWSFSRDGKLHACRGMHDCDTSALGLQKIATITVAGLVFINLADEPIDPKPLQQLFAAAEPHGFEVAKVAHAIDYRVAADWKLIWENNRECYHCDAGHPQYVRANFDIAEGDRDTPLSRAAQTAVLARTSAYWDAEGLSLKHVTGGLASYPDPDDPCPFPVSATRTVQVEGYQTESLDGQRVAPFMGRLQSPDVGVLRLRSIPSFWCHASCDHAVLTRVLPAELGVTNIRVTWLVTRDAKELINYSLDRLLPFWQLTSEQDWEMCERQAKGVNSRAYRPGPLSKVREYNVEAFYHWYLARLR
ncbi:MAG: Rieske (2Fe-2S) protein [Schlesneria sp.]|nr:Rieske (2Fe-2S) protein [Schlesneria sp.]